MSRQDIVGVGIVGGGVSGSSLFCQLVNKLLESPPDQPITIHWWESSDKFGPGLAWGNTNSDVHLFNFPAGVASLLPGRFGEFLPWCREHGVDADFNSYPPRNTLGPFLENYVEECCVRARDAGIVVDLHSSCLVTSMEPIRDTQTRPDLTPIRVEWKQAQGGDRHSTVVSAAILCTGPASLVNQSFKHLSGCNNYISSPWPFTELSVIPPGARVAIIGSGLTAVDVAKQLQAQRHIGPILMASRHGLLPAVKASTFDPFRPLTVATTEAVDEAVATGGKHSTGLLNTFVAMISSEIVRFYEEYYAAAEPDTDYSDKLASVERHIVNALSGNFRTGKDELRQGIDAQGIGGRIPWQDCFIALDIADVPRYMWRFLCDEEKLEFDTKYRTIMQVYFNAMPLSSATDMLLYMESSLITLRSQFKGVSPLTGSGGEEFFEVCFQPTDCTDGEKVHVDYVINAVGFEKRFDNDYLSVVSPFYNKLLKSGTVVADRFGGLQCEFDTGRLLSSRWEVSDGEEGDVVPSPLFYGIGHLICGTKLLTSGLSYCTRDAALVACDLMKSLFPPPPPRRSG